MKSVLYFSMIIMKITDNTQSSTSETIFTCLKVDEDITVNINTSIIEDMEYFDSMINFKKTQNSINNTSEFKLPSDYIKNQDQLNTLVELLAEDYISGNVKIYENDFIDFISLSNFLGLRNKTLVRFFKNLVKCALRSSETLEIFQTILPLDLEYRIDIPWQLFIQYVELKKCQIRYSEERKEISIIQKDSISQDKYGTLISPFNKRPDIKKLSVYSNKIFQVQNNKNTLQSMTAFTWFLYHLVIIDLDLKQWAHMHPKYKISLAKALLYYIEESFKESYLPLKGLDISSNNIDNNDIRLLDKVLQNLPDLTMLKISIKKDNMNINDPVFLTNLSNIKVLIINGQLQSKEFINVLLDNLNPMTIQEISITAELLDPEIAGYFKRYKYLKYLNISGQPQSKEFINALLNNLNPMTIQEISITAELLDPEIDSNNLKIPKALRRFLFLDLFKISKNILKSFERFTSLKSLTILGECQSSDFMKLLLDSLHCTDIEKVNIKTKKLDIETVKNFQKFTLLKVLFIYGDYQSNDFIKALIKNLNRKSIEKLTLIAEPLDSDIADILQEFKLLKSINIHGKFQHNDFIIALLTSLNRKSIKKISIKTYKLNLAAIPSFQGFDLLESLNIYGVIQPSDFIIALLNSLNYENIKEITITSKTLDFRTAEIFQRFILLESLIIDGECQSSDFTNILLNNLNQERIKKLILMLENLDESIARSWRSFPHLELLAINGEEQSNQFFEILLPKIKHVSDLSIIVNEPSSKVGNLLSEFKNLTSLAVGGLTNEKSLCELIPKLSNVSELTIDMRNLSHDILLLFKQYRNLEKLVIFTRKDYIYTYFIANILNSLKDSKLFRLEIRIWLYNESKSILSYEDKETIKVAQKDHIHVIIWSHDDLLY